MKKKLNVYHEENKLMNIADYIKSSLPQWPNWVNKVLLRLNVFGPLVYGRSYMHFRKVMLDISPENHLLNMVNYAIKNVPYYRERYGNITINSIQEFERKIDFINKDEVMSHWGKFIADGVNLQKCVVGTTGGTSGKPLRIANSKGRYVTELVFIHNMWKRTGWNYSTRGVIRNHKLPKDKIYMINPITKELIFDAFRISSIYVREIVSVLKKHRVKYIHAYPSTSFQFCKICMNENIDISFIKCFLCGSEAVSEEQYRFVVGKMGIRIYSWYGHSEKLILGGNEKTSSIHIEPYYGWFELVSDEGKVLMNNNTMGEMVGTTFYNYVMPLIRYRTGDYAILNRARKKNSDYAVLKEIVGRWNKNLIFRTDGTTTTITALNLHNDIYDKIDGIQFIQDKEGELTICIIEGKDFTIQIKQKLYQHCKDAMGIDSKIEIKSVNNLIFLPNGKFLPLISNVNNN